MSKRLHEQKCTPAVQVNWFTYSSKSSNICQKHWIYNHTFDQTAASVVSHSLAASGDLEGLEIWSLAGADFNKPGYDGQTAVEVVRTEVFQEARALSTRKTKPIKGKKTTSFLFPLPTGPGCWQTGSGGVTAPAVQQ